MVDSPWLPHLSSYVDVWASGDGDCRCHNGFRFDVLRSQLVKGLRFNLRVFCSNKNHIRVEFGPRDVVQVEGSTELAENRPGDVLSISRRDGKCQSGRFIEADALKKILRELA